MPSVCRSRSLPGPWPTRSARFWRPRNKRMIGAEALHVQLDYSSWASSRLLDEAVKLTSEELTRDSSTADRSVLGTLAHVFAADRMWLGRIQGNPPSRFIDPAVDLDLPRLQSAWPALNERWTAWAVGLADGDAQTVLQ